MASWSCSGSCVGRERESEREREKGGSALTLYICVCEYAATNGWGGRDVCMGRCVYVCMCVCVCVCCMCVLTRAHLHRESDPGRKTAWNADSHLRLQVCE